MHQNKNTNCFHFAENMLNTSRFVYDKPPQVDTRYHRPMSGEKDELLREHLKTDSKEKIDALLKENIFGPIFKQMLDDKVQFQDWSGDTSMAEKDMRKYFDNTNVPKEQRDFWFAKDKGVFAKLGHPKTSIEYKEGLAALEGFKRALVDVNLYRAQEMVRSEQETLSSEPVLEKGKEFLNNVVDGFKNGDGFDKAIMIAGAYMLFQGLGKLKNKNLPGSDSWTWGDVMTYGGLYLGANLISLKATGKSLGEHIGFSDPKSDLNKTEYQKFAMEFNIKDAKELEMMLQLGNSNIESLYKLYTSPYSEKKEGNTIQWIDPYAAGVDTDITDDKSRKEKGILIYKLMNALVQKAGGRKEFENRYINKKLIVKDESKDKVEKVDWNFRTVAWDLMRLESLREGMSPMERVMRGIGRTYLGREAMSYDASVLDEEFPWKDTWDVEILKLDDTEKDEKGKDGKIWIKINGVLLLAEREVKTDPLSSNRTKLTHYKFTPKGSRVSKEVAIREKDGKPYIDPGKLETIDKMLEKNVHERVKGTTFVQGPPPVNLADKIRWIKGEGWVYKDISLPATPYLNLPAIPKADLIVTPQDDGGVRLDIRGVAGLNPDLRLLITKEGYHKDRVKNQIFNQPEFHGLQGLSPYGHTEIKQENGKTVVEFSIGKAKLPLYFNTTSNKWEVYVANVPAGTTAATAKANIEKAFASDPDIANALGKVELLDRNSELNKAIQEMKDVFKAMPESFFQHFGQKFIGIFTRASLNAPFKGAQEFFSSGTSGSVQEYYAEEMAKYKKQEIADLYEFKVKSATSIADLAKVQTDVLHAAIHDIRQINNDLKVESNSRRTQDGHFTEKESMEAIERYIALPSLYKSEFYRSTILDFAKNAFENMDKAGFDMSDWHHLPHAIQAKMMAVVVARTKEMALDPDLDDTDFMKFVRQKEARENLLGYDRTKPATDPHNKGVLAVAQADPLWRSFKADEERCVENLHQQMYVDYVVNQVAFKTVAWAAKNSGIDETIDKVPGPYSSEWEISDYNAFARNGNRVARIETLYKQMPKLDKAQVKIRIDRIMKVEIGLALKRSGDYDPVAIDDMIRDIQKGVYQANVPYLELIKLIAAMPNRADQEMALKGAADHIRRLLESNDNKIPKKPVKSIWKHMGEWMTNAYEFIKFW